MVSKNELLDEIVQKVSELDAQVSANKTEEKSVGRLKRKARALRVIGSLISTFIEDDEFTFDMENEMLQMLECKKGKKITFDIKPGDKLMEVLEKYQDVKDVYNKVKKYAESHGMKLVLDHFE